MALSGKSLLNEALSPSSQVRLRDYLVLAADEQSTEGRNSSTNGGSLTKLLSSPAARQISMESTASSDRINMQRRGSMLFKTLQTQKDASFVQIQCDSRPFGLKLALDRGQMKVVGFAPVDGKSQKGTIETTGLVQEGDVLVAVNDEMDGLMSVEETVQVLKEADLPAILTFRRLVAVRGTLGEYSKEDIVRHLLIHENTLTETRSVDETALLILGCIEALHDSTSTTSLSNYITHIEQLLAPAKEDKIINDPSIRDQRLVQLKQMMDSVHQCVEVRKKELHKQWNAQKTSNFKRIEILTKQRSSIDAKLEKMRENPSLLHPENQEVWQEYIELRHLSNQMLHGIEKSKQEHYLPEFEGYSMRFGSGGIYIGIGDIWIPSFHAKFTIETRSSAPHVFLHLSTPATRGFKLRAKNFKLSTEGRLPSFHCDELNIEAQLVADIGLVFDSINGWSVPQEELHVELMSLVYYERQANSTQRGKDHDTVMKLFINRMLPFVVRHAAQHLLCVELGPLLEARNAQVALTGEFKIQGRRLSLYDAPLNSSIAGDSPSVTKLRKYSDEAREMVGIDEADADAIFSVFKSLVDFRSNKITLFGKSEPHPSLSIRNLLSYFERFNQFPHLKELACALWGLSVQLHLPVASPTASSSRLSLSMDHSAPLSFAYLVSNLERINEFPVDISVSLLDMTFKLDLCETAATCHACLQRIIRQKAESSSVGLANLDSMRDGTYLESELAKLDERYGKLNRLFGYITLNADDFGVVFRGGMPAGFTSKLFVEATELACKGPCGGSLKIPLTDLSALANPNGIEIPKQRHAPSMSTLTHENGALVFSKFFLGQHHDCDIASDNGDPDASVTNGYSEDNDASSLLPSDRIRVSVKNTAARVIFEVPSDLSQLEPGSTLVPFAFSVITNEEGTEQPQLQFETGPFAKLQYKAERIAMSGSVWQYLKQAKATISDLEDANVPATGQLRNAGKSERVAKSIWYEYLESEYFSLKFHFFTSCKVTRDYIFWSIRSASLTDPKVAQLKHRVSIGQLLHDVGSVSIVGGNTSQMRRRRNDMRSRSHTSQLHHDQSARYGRRASSIISNFSQSETLFSVREGSDNGDQRSEPFSVDDADSIGQDYRENGDNYNASDDFPREKDDNQLLDGNANDYSKANLPTPSPIIIRPVIYEKQASVFF